MPNCIAVGHIRRIVLTLCAAAVIAILTGAASAEASWTIRATPNPLDGTQNVLYGVSCPSSTFCFATGSYQRPKVGGVVPLGEDSVGEWPFAEWFLNNPEVPKPESELAVTDGVACVTNVFCEAVGAYNKKRSGFAELWNGSEWHIQETPVLTEPENVEVTAVSCTSTTVCESVGRVRNELLAEAWNGTKWTKQAVLPSTGEESLRGVSCTSATFCEAVGVAGYVNEGLGFPVGRRWNGTSWVSANPKQPEGNKLLRLNAVSCASANACEATGVYENASHVDVPLAERWNGIEWQIQSTPTPAGAKLSTLDAVSCPAAESCTAAGHYQNSSGVNVTLVEVWNGSTWTVESTPNPEGATESLLRGISCRSATVCTAVGEYKNSSGVKLTLAETH
jgi:hypothetical protein